ncbi:AAA family ATPase [Bacteroides hominis]|uniref:AAA family ATPase n=2 Tax=Bacteroides TaxID=816 RepID=UPI003D6BCEA7
MNKGFSILGVQVYDTCHEHIKKVLTDRLYLFNSWYHNDNQKLVSTNETDFVRTLYGKNISIQAIVGKNGSGKSTIMELVYRIINNLSVVMVRGMDRPAAQPMYYVRGVYGKLLFESDGKLGSIICEDNIIKFQWGEDESIVIKGTDTSMVQSQEDKEHLVYISRHFCYTLVCNYAMMSLVASDFNRDVCSPKTIHNGIWIEGIYNKNDGYQAAIGFEPYKGGGNISINRQKQLNDERLASMLIDFARHQKPFFEDYYLSQIKLEFQKDSVNNKYNKNSEEKKYWHRHPENEIAFLWRKKKSFAYQILKAYGFEYFNLKDKVVRTAMAYLVYKTLSVGENYPQYMDYKIVAHMNYYAKQTGIFDKRFSTNLVMENKDYDSSGFYGSAYMLFNLCSQIQKARTHAELKIRQVLNFLNAVKNKYQVQGKKWECPKFASYDQYMQTMYPKHVLKSPQEILNFYPPQFFNDTIILKQKGIERPLYALSSGEKQFMQTLATIVYHLRNIISVEDLPGLAKYNNVNLMLDEVETCFHPEYQQKFIKSLIDMFNNSSIIKSININVILATHSPFILSDIPDSNILFLENGDLPQKSIKGTFCGNVCELLEQSFFLQSGFMGYYAKSIITDLLFYLKPHENIDYRLLHSWNQNNSKVLINLIGEPILKNSLMRLWNQKFEKGVDELVEWHKKEIKRLIQKHNK